MKQFLRPLFLLCLPVLLVACEKDDPESDPKQVECLETRQTNSAGISSERVYNGDRIIELHTLRNGDLLRYYTFDYGSDGRISESHYVNVENESQNGSLTVSYNSGGKWVDARGTNSNGDTYIYEAEYDSQNQLKKFTYKTENDGNVTVYYTITYEWEGGNNTGRTFTSSTQQTVTRYEFDLDQENKRRQEQEKVAFLYTDVAYNKNMRERTVFSSTDLASGTTTETITKYDYAYNEAGYPTDATVTTTTGTATPTVSTTTIEYSCE